MITPISFKGTAYTDSGRVSTKNDAEILDGLTKHRSSCFPGLEGNGDFYGYIKGEDGLFSLISFQNEQDILVKPVGAEISGLFPKDTFQWTLDAKQASAEVIEKLKVAYSHFKR